MNTIFLSPKHLHIIRIEQRDTHIGPIEHSDMLYNTGKITASDDLKHHNGIDPIILTAKNPSTWNNSFGDMWRANAQKHKNIYNKDNAPWRFAIEANQSNTFINGVASLIQQPVEFTDFVIATYTCPAHTWFRNNEGQIAFLYDRAIRHTHVIDQTNIDAYLTHASTQESTNSTLFDTFIPNQRAA